MINLCFIPEVPMLANSKTDFGTYILLILITSRDHSWDIIKMSKKLCPGKICILDLEFRVEVMNHGFFSSLIWG